MSDYQKIEEEGNESAEYPHYNRYKKTKYDFLVKAFHWSAHCALVLVSISFLWYKLHLPKDPSQITYSPASNVISYEERAFVAALPYEKSEYQGKPSVELDLKWARLIHGLGLARVPVEEAAKLPYPPCEIHNDPGYFVVELDVFHQLHCLNSIRKLLLDPDYYKEDLEVMFADEKSQRIHTEHCIDSIRQSLVCHADISPMTWVWDEEREGCSPVAQNVHTCRNFDKVRQWVEDHKLLHHFEPEKMLKYNWTERGTQFEYRPAEE